MALRLNGTFTKLQGFNYATYSWELIEYWDEEDVAYSTSTEDLLNFKDYIGLALYIDDT